MNLVDYRELKKTKNVDITLVNGVPTISAKKYHPNTGALLNDVEQGEIKISELHGQIANLQLQIDILKEVIKDVEALLKPKE